MTSLDHKDVQSAYSHVTNKESNKEKRKYIETHLILFCMMCIQREGNRPCRLK